MRHSTCDRIGVGLCVALFGILAGCSEATPKTEGTVDASDGEEDAAVDVFRRTDVANSRDGQTSVDGPGSDGQTFAEVLPPVGTDANMTGDWMAGDTQAMDASDGPSGTDTAPLSGICPATDPCKVMPLGDSITWGEDSTDTGGYRSRVFRRAVEANKLLLQFVGTNKTGPAMVAGRPFPSGNEGHRGFTIEPLGGRKGISTLVQAALTTHKPHVVLLMAGTNDLGNGLDVDTAPDRMVRLIDTILATAPNVTLFVAQLVPGKFDSYNVVVRAFNAEVLKLVQARRAQGKRILSVDVYGKFASTGNIRGLINDTVHPNDAGYEVMAEAWYAALGPSLR